MTIFVARDSIVAMDQATSAFSEPNWEGSWLSHAHNFRPMLRQHTTKSPMTQMQQKRSRGNITAVGDFRPKTII